MSGPFKLKYKNSAFPFKGDIKGLKYTPPKQSKFKIGGYGGGSGGDVQPPPVAMVTIQGVFDDGTPTSPIGNALCRFVDEDGTQLATTTTSTPDGSFSLSVRPGAQGFVRCTPPGLPSSVRAPGDGIGCLKLASVPTTWPPVESPIQKTVTSPSRPVPTVVNWPIRMLPPL